MPQQQLLARNGTSEENPALPLSQLSHPSTSNTLAPSPLAVNPAPGLAAPVHRPDHLARPRRQRGCMVVCCVILAILSNGIYAGVIAAYVNVTAAPLPRGVLNRTEIGWKLFYEFLMSIVTAVGIIDGYMVAKCIWALPIDRFPALIQCTVVGISWLVSIGIWGLIFVVPFLVGTSVSQASYAHACDSDWLQVVLTGYAYNASGRSTAAFSLVETGEPLWTWTSNVSFENDFNLAGLDSTRPSLMPALSNITISNSTNELTRAWCYNSTNQCATGYFRLLDGLFLEVQFNGTVTRMRNRYPNWTFQKVPSVMMYRVDEDGRLAERLLQTSIESPGRCGLLKLCVTHAMRRREGLVDPDVLVAAGWLLNKVAVRRRQCV